MAFWCLINRLKLEQIPKQFSRNHVLASSVNQVSNPTNIRPMVHPNLDIRKIPNSFPDHVRFFAAPVQARKVKEEEDGPCLNEQIRVPYIRLVTEEGHCVVTRLEALRRAKQLELDLVLVQKTSDPPVCKIMDYHKEKYKRELVGKERAKSKRSETTLRADIKEVRFASKIEQKDLKFKAETAMRMMERGYRVKCMAVVENNKEVPVEKLAELLSRFTPLIEESAVIESGPMVEKRHAYVVVRHSKFGPSKKGGSKKLKDVDMKAIRPSPNLSKEDSGDDDGSKAEDKKMGWSVLDSGDDLNEEFDLNDSAEEQEGAPGNNAFDNNGRDAVSSSNESRSIRGENRYLKKEPRSQFPPGRSTDNRGLPGGRDAGRFEPRFPNQTPNQQFSHPGFPNQTPSQRFSRPGFPNEQSPRPGFSNQTPNRQPSGQGFPNHTPSQQPSRSGFPNQIPNQQPLGPGSPNQNPSRHGIPGNPASGYGIFSNQRTDGNRSNE